MQSDGNLVLYASSGGALWSSGTYGQNCSTNQCVAIFQADGNFVVYKRSTPLWSSSTYGNPSAQLVISPAYGLLQIENQGATIWASSYRFPAGSLTLTEGESIDMGTFTLIMQNDGNFVLYGAGNAAVWSTGTYGQAAAPVIAMQSFKQTEILSSITAPTRSGAVTPMDMPMRNSFFSRRGRIWRLSRATSRSSGKTGHFELPQGATANFGNFVLAMQTDGNFVLYNSQTGPLWSSGTYGQNCGANQCLARFQNDGNLVVYDGSTALWSSATYGNPQAQLVLSQQAPELKILSSNQAILWQSNH
jgi:hypothetical protein